MSKSDTGNIVSRQTSRTDFHQGEHDEEEEEELDPRIQIELEKLNSSTDVINKLEIDLEEARATFRSLLSDSGQQLSRLSRQLGSCVDRSRPYYEARMRSRHALIEAQRAAARFEKASSQHEAAKEMVLLAEEGYIERGMPFDQAWQEMLNHSTTRVNDSEIERNLSAEEHRAKSQAYQTAEARVLDLQRNLKRSINKSSFKMTNFHEKDDHFGGRGVTRSQKATIKAFDKFYSMFPSFLDVFPDEDAFLTFAFWFLISTLVGAIILSRYIKLKPSLL